MKTEIKNKSTALFGLEREIFIVALKESFLKLSLKVQAKNPVMLVTEVGAIMTTLIVIFGGGHAKLFETQIAIWLWFTVIFANLAESIAEGRGKAQAASLKKSRTSVVAKKIAREKVDAAMTDFKAPLRTTLFSTVNALELEKGDIVYCEAGDVIPGDGEVIQGIASIDESAITGESASVIRESGGDRSAVTGGTLVLSDRILVRITTEVGDSFLDRMIALVEGAKRQKTPNELALSIVLSGLTIVFLLAVMTMKPFADFAISASPAGSQLASQMMTVPVFIALLVCLIPTTIGGLLSAIGISGMDRLIRKNVIATSGRAVEAAGDIDVLLLDKTGTITLGNRMASNFLPVQGISEEQLAMVAQLASLSDETAEGRSIVKLSVEKFGSVAAANVALAMPFLDLKSCEFIPFTAQTRMSGVNVMASKQVSNSSQTQIHEIRKGASDSIKSYVLSSGGHVPADLDGIVESVARSGGTPLVVADRGDVLGVIQLKDVVKPGIKERFLELRKMGIRTVMITGDNHLTAAAIAAEAGVDDFMAQATPESKLRRIRDEQNQGHLVAMTGDGTNDAPALAQADVGVAMNTGTQAAREAGNMVDLDSNPTKLIEIVEIGKQLLMTRGSLTTFSIANDVVKYFAILPALFGTLYIANGASNEGPLAALNLMRLASPQSAILSAVIFNALVIIALIPLAVRGVKYRAVSASEVLKYNLLIYGLGGILVPFVGIKVIDLIITSLGWV